MTQSNQSSAVQSASLLASSEQLATEKSQRTLFIFGTLLDADILSLVLARQVSQTDLLSASVAGFKKVTYPGDSFPILIADQDSHATGALLLNLTQEDVDRMDFYEGDEYGFGDIKAQTTDGLMIDAKYNKAADNGITSDEIWHLSHWQLKEKPSFIGFVARYMALYGKMSVDEADAIWRDMVDN